MIAAFFSTTLEKVLHIRAIDLKSHLTDYSEIIENKKRLKFNNEIRELLDKYKKCGCFKSSILIKELHGLLIEFDPEVLNKFIEIHNGWSELRRVWIGAVNRVARSRRSRYLVTQAKKSRK